MKAIALLYWQICRLQTGPEQVPVASSLTLLTLLAYAVVIFIGRMFFAQMPLQYTLLSLVLLTTFWALLVYGVLVFKGYGHRFQQTFTAVVGTDIVLTLISLPVVILALKLSQTSPLMQVAALAWLVIFIWDVVVKGFIFSRALQVSPLLGNLFALGLNLLIVAVDQSLLDHFAPQLLEAKS